MSLSFISSFPSLTSRELASKSALVTAGSVVRADSSSVPQQKLQQECSQLELNEKPVLDLSRNFQVSRCFRHGPPLPDCKVELENMVLYYQTAKSKLEKDRLLVTL